MRICFSRSGSTLSRGRSVGIDWLVTVMPLFLGLGFDDQEAALDGSARSDGLALDGELAGLDLGDVEDAVDQAEQVFGGLADIAGILADLVRIAES